MTTHISQDSIPVQCNILVLVGWSEEENCLLADHSEEVQLVYLFCIILANTKTPAVAQGTMLDQIWVPVTGNCTKYFGSQLGLLITSQLLQVFIKVIFLQTKRVAQYFVIGRMTERKSGKSRLGDCKEDFMP